MLDKEKEKLKCKNNSKFISKLTEEEKICNKDDDIPIKVLNEIKNYPDNFLFPSDSKKWKIIDFKEEADGSFVLRSINISKNFETPYDRELFSMISPSINDLFKLEKEQLKKGILKEFSEKTLTKHTEEDTFIDYDLKEFNVVSELGTVKEELDTLIEKKDGKTVKKKDFGGLKINGK